ncbi:MAG: hypothetical protein ABI851_09580 [Saprospiraceae bacterium]
MLQLFRRNMIFNNLLLLPYILVVHGGRFIINYGQDSLENSWLFDLLISRLHIGSQESYYLSIIFIFFEATLINVLVNKNKINPEGQLFPGLIFIILTGFHPMLFAFSPILIANLFFILGLLSMVSTYLMKNASLSIFNYGFYIGLATVFYSPYSWMILLGIIGLTVFRGLSIREFMQMISGFMVVFFLFYFLLYLSNTSSLYNKSQIFDFFRPYIFSLSYNGKGLIAFLIIFFLFIISFIRFVILQVKSSISTQKIYYFLFWISFFSMLTLCFSHITSLGHLIILISPLCIFLGIILSRIKNELLSETLHLFFALFALFLQLQNW